MNKKFSNLEKKEYYHRLFLKSGDSKKKKYYLGRAKSFERKSEKDNIIGHVADLKIELKGNKYGNQHLDSIIQSMNFLFPSKKKKKSKKDNKVALKKKQTLVEKHSKTYSYLKQHPVYDNVEQALYREYLNDEDSDY